RIRRPGVIRARQREEPVQDEPEQGQQREEPEEAGCRPTQRVCPRRYGFLEEHQPLRMLMLDRSTVCLCRKRAMMIASPTAASAAATVMTKKTKTCPATPYTCANATEVRFTALSISSTHMKTMIALRRVSTPTTPIMNRTALKNNDSLSMGTLPALPQHDGPDDRRAEQHARDLEGQQVLVEHRRGHRRDRALRR